MLTWPDGKQFAFTIFDDTDWASLAVLRPVYDLLADVGFRTTKSVWMLKGSGPGRRSNAGATCEDADYREWVLGLQRRGFEIGLHNVAPLTSERSVISRGLAEFRHAFGGPPRVHCNHTGCEDNLYWGVERFSGWRRAVYTGLGRNALGRSEGHNPDSPLFWGDLCQQQIHYVRNFVYSELNTLSVCPEMPYRDAAKPWVNWWFASTEAGNIHSFLRNFTPHAIDELRKQHGLCIAYVHFAGGFAPEGKLDPEFRRRVEYIAGQNPWVAPVSEVLNYLRANRTHEQPVSAAALRRLEVRWLADRGLTKAIHVFTRNLGTKAAAI
jgi:hypothetical protein